MTTKSKALSMRISENLKDRYEVALEKAGVSATDHLTMTILDFIVMVDSKFSDKEKTPEL